MYADDCAQLQYRPTLKDAILGFSKGVQKAGDYKNCDISDKTMGTGLTPLYCHVSNNDIAAVKAELGQGANPNQGRIDAQQIKDEYGCSPIYVAAEDGYLDILELLLQVCS